MLRVRSYLKAHLVLCSVQQSESRWIGAVVDFGMLNVSVVGGAEKNRRGEGVFREKVQAYRCKAREVESKVLHARRRCVRLLRLARQSPDVSSKKRMGILDRSDWSRSPSWVRY